MIQLRPYQQKLYDEVCHKLFQANVRKLCVQAECGFGKSILIAKLALDLPGRTLVLTHRSELLEQNSAWIDGAGVLTAKKNTVDFNTKIAVVMVETMFARVSKFGVKYLGDFDNILIDECHIDAFGKVFEMFDYKFLLGFTATPTSNNKIHTEVDGVEFIQDHTLSEIFDDIVCGIDAKELVKLGFLCGDYNIVLRPPGIDKLKSSDTQPDGFTRQSLDEVYNNKASFEVLMKAYNEYCVGKKTMIFNANTKINKGVYEFFLEKGLNVKLFDTVNDSGINPETDKKWKRQEIVEWFRNEKDAILINTNVFTTGFDVDDVECIIFNRATTSLSLYLQAAGRGSRITKKIYKDFFTFIDLGENIDRFDTWSASRNWESFFYPRPPRRKQKADLLATWDCHRCGMINLVGDIVCEECGAPKPKRKNDKKDKDGELVEYNKMPNPRASSIINYSISQGQNRAFAFNLLDKKILELFIFYEVDYDYFKAEKDRFLDRVREIYRPIYFGIMGSSLKGPHKKLRTRYKNIIIKIEKYYEGKRTN